MSESNKQLVRRFFDEVCNGRDLAAAGTIFTTGHVYHDPSSPGIADGPQGMKDLIGAYQTGFPDAHWAVDQTMADGDTVITRWTGSGTHRGDLLGIAPTGKQVSIPGVWIHRIENGRIAESWNVWDTLGMLQQLGVVAELGQAAAV